MNFMNWCYLFRAIGAITTAVTFMFLVSHRFKRRIKRKQRQQKLHQYACYLIKLLKNLDYQKFMKNRKTILITLYMILSYRDVAAPYDFVNVLQNIVAFEKMNSANQNQLTSLVENTIALLKRMKG